MPRKYKRKTYYIKNSAQSKFIFRFVLISIIGGLGAVTAFNILAYKKIDSVLYSMRLPNISPGGLLWNEMLYTNIFVVIFTLIIFAITARSLYIKVNGPLKKMTCDINKIAAGDLSFKITLRDRDEFKDFAVELNKVINNFNSKFSEISEINHKILSLTEKNTANKEPHPSLNEIKNSISDLENVIGSFKI